ncbi:MAG: hypothetical protein IPI83_07985 [Sphingomonadales bacterium]|nr:hypothetical protein [Sphingomonadales bacterium]
MTQSVLNTLMDSNCGPAHLYQPLRQCAVRNPRQAATANNLANAQTPGFSRRSCRGAGAVGSWRWPRKQGGCVRRSSVPTCALAW